MWQCLSLSEGRICRRQLWSFRPWHGTARCPCLRERRWRAPLASAARASLQARAAPARGVEARESQPSMSTAAVTEGTASRIVQPGKQTVDYTCLVACGAELNRDWAPSKVENVLMADPNTLVMQLRTLESSGWLYLSWHPLAARVSLGGPPERGEASEAYSFAKQAGQHLRGQVLQSAQLPEAWERVLRLSFGARPGEPAAQQLFCEVQARRSNVILTQADRRVLGAAHQVGQKHSSLRQVRLGAEYQLPPPPRGIAPSPDEPDAEWKRNVVSAALLARAEAASPPAWAAGREATVAEGLMRAYLAVSPSLSSDLCSLAGVSPYAAAEQLDDAAWSRLHRQWLRWLGGLRHGKFDCGRCSTTGSFSVLGAFSTPPHSARYGSVLQMLHDCYAELQVQERFKQLEQALRRSVAVAERKLKGRLASFDKQLGSEEQEAVARKQADMLMAVLHCVEPGADSVTVEDWDTGEKVELTLDPERTPLESAQALYKRAGKLRRGQAVLQPLREEAMQQLVYLEEVRSALQQLASDFAGAQDLRALYEIQDELVDASIVQPPPDASLAAKGAAKARRAAKRQGKRAGSEFREFRSPGGLQVLVGRNNKQNDRLTFDVASKQDLWMHARGVPGCHLVLRPPPGQAAAQADLEFAAHLAAYYSKARNDSKVPVIVTEVSNIKKPKGAPPGNVACLKEKVIIGCPNRSAAARQQSV